MKKFGFLLLAVCNLVAASEASAAVEWIDGSLKSVYSPGAPVSDLYSYAPCAIRDGKVEHFWFCRNLQEGNIRDHIFHLQRENGLAGDCKPVFFPARIESWDSFHVCDPSVIGGTFQFGGITYPYAMFYLGTAMDASSDNQIGVAFAQSLSGEWLRDPKPLITHKQDGQWGVGQPSAINLDGESRVLVFYTKGEKQTRAFFREIDFSKKGEPKVSSENKVPVEGLTQSDGVPDWLNNFDVVYDRRRERVYLVREQHPYPLTDPSIISASLQIASIPAKDLRRSRGRWRVEATITPSLTGYMRNHNPGFERTVRGELPDPDRIKVVFSTSCAGADCMNKSPLWSYSIWEITGQLGDEVNKTGAQ